MKFTSTQQIKDTIKKLDSLTLEEVVTLLRKEGKVAAFFSIAFGVLLFLFMDLFMFEFELRWRSSMLLSFSCTIILMAVYILLMNQITEMIKINDNV